MDKTEIKLLADRILVRPLTAEKKTKGGIIIPDTVAAELAKGVVVSVGPGYKVLEGDKAGEVVILDVKAGDTIIFQKDNGMRIEHNDESLLLMTEREVIAVI